MRRRQFEPVRELVLAARRLARTPTYTAAVVLTLGLGTGGLAALLTVARASLLVPLPYHEPQDLVRLYETATGPYSGEVTSLPNVIAWQERIRNLEFITAVSAGSHVNLRVGDDTRRVMSASMSEGGFEMLGVRPFLGGTLEAVDYEPGAAPRVVLSHDLWRGLGSDSSLVGQFVRINGRDVQVAGVMPRGFGFPDAATQVIVPLPITPGVGLATPNGRWARLFQAYGRLRPDITMEQANSELLAVSTEVGREFGDPNRGMVASSKPLRDAMVGEGRTLLLMLLAASFLVLLVACSNVAALTFVHMSAQERGIAIRLVHGATRRQIIGMLAAETAIIAASAALLGGAFAVALRPLVALLVPSGMPVQPVTAFTLLGTAAIVSVLSSALLLMAVLPARAQMPGLARSLVTGGARAGWSRVQRRTRIAVVTAQVALAVALLVGGTALLRSYIAMLNVQPGFNPDDAMVVSISPRGPRYVDRSALVRLYTQALERVRGTPGVQAAGITDALPLSNDGTSWTYVPGGQPIAPGQELSAIVLVIDEGYTAATGIPLVAGRQLTPTDTFPAAEGVLVSDALARRSWGSRAAAIGRTIILGNANSGNVPMSIVGVVGDVNDATLNTPAAAAIYRRFSGSTMPGTMHLAVRATVPAPAMFASISAVINDLDADASVFDARPMSALLRESATSQRLTAILASSFAALAFVLAVFGIIGLFSQLVLHEQRTMAIRLALGATRQSVIVRMARTAGIVTACGIAGGCIVAVASRRVLGQMLFGVRALDPVAVSGIAGILFVVGLLSAVVLTWRGTRVGIATTLRAE